MPHGARAACNAFCIQSDASTLVLRHSKLDGSAGVVEQEAFQGDINASYNTHIGDLCQGGATMLVIQME
ncbi:hypothetical protein GCM10010971_34950 [Silvimonas amylolytica]|uniref:Uncharacterized protein n=1 Tax=Silvimonas amylolytica TaxID=449663 RepID=A0ABQ2PQR1_9NEIS|nr:hypothetical protein GCM10010971_34950 [Silvimonas amylolytica]